MAGVGDRRGSGGGNCGNVSLGVLKVANRIFEYFKPKRKEQPRDNRSYGTRLFCWRFNHPKFGWCGGHDDDNWTPKKEAVQSAMQHCEWPSELLEKVV